VPGPIRSRHLEYGSVSATVQGKVGLHPMAKNVRLSDVQPITQYRQLPPALLELLAAASKLLLYVHGFATRFEDAAARLAQLCEALGFTDPSVCFAWASAARTSPRAYNTDCSTAAASQDNFWELLSDLAQAVGPSACYPHPQCFGCSAICVLAVVLQSER